MTHRRARGPTRGALVFREASIAVAASALREKLAPAVLHRVPSLTNDRDDRLERRR